MSMLLLPVDSQVREKHWTQKKCHILQADKSNTMSDPIGSREMVVIPLLHLKLVLMKQFVKALNAVGRCFQYVVFSFSALCFEKIKSGVFDGSQILHTFACGCELTGRQKKKSALLSFKTATQNFLGSRKEDNYEILVIRMLLDFCVLECNMSVKLHFLFNHLD
ncbi:hypothetical protein AVEN_157920-1 [Araneus ventricosus]|uniref:Uncharacterized protein n=1 Tax=Araneus ventricosus TaxID=182803 RepID=A0A4Y2LC14_ARAVE|nr:hypothetical protein AVEN_157920-1 [Araneus ventricosus]